MPIRVVARAESLVEAGVDSITVGIGGDGSGYDLGPLRELVQWRDRRNAAAA
jgi:hypothetical protein